MTPLSPDEARILAVTCASVRASVAAGVAVLSPEAETWLDVAERGAAGVLALVAEADALREALRFVCRADTDVCDFCGATATKRSPGAPRWGAWWCDACAPADAADHEHAATLRPLLPPRGATKAGTMNDGNGG